MAKIFNNKISKLFFKSEYLIRRNYNKFFSTLQNVNFSGINLDELVVDINKLEYIEKNASLRKTEINLKEIKNLIEKIHNNKESNVNIEKLKNELLKIPNKTHPDILNYNDIPKLLSKFNELPKFNFKPLSFKDITKNLNLLRMEHLGNFNGHKSYYLTSTLATLEHALIQYTLDILTKQYNFQLVSVPDILPAKIIEGCGMQTDGERTQVYKLKNSEKCLSGTSEMALAGLFSDEIINENDLPIKLTSVSRCYRAETSGLQEEKGIYRVHQFTKVEMFSICHDKQSDDILNEFKNIEINLFDKLNLHFKLLDMPPSDLGNPAYRKYDIEAWMPGRKMWGEISSCSNCTDYQSKRLNIKIRKNNNNSLSYAHTVNGTACAIPRMLIALLETFQKQNGEVDIPIELQPYLNGKTTITKEKLLPELKLIKSVKSLS